MFQHVLTYLQPDSRIIWAQCKSKKCPWAHVILSFIQSRVSQRSGRRSLLAFPALSTLHPPDWVHCHFLPIWMIYLYKKAIWWGKTWNILSMYSFKSLWFVLHTSQHFWLVCSDDLQVDTLVNYFTLEGLGIFWGYCVLYIFLLTKNIIYIWEFLKIKWKN